ncbi:MAG: hypothetical protein DWB56_14730 [Candidatus Jettenia sp.]|uniref:Uncharacterized protein n=1 Tax=Candidatus Jettenia caeni TaxID=247490 RepID=I3ILU2_9BACT|nr:MAG: hypothetical protein EDM70_10115 [Candidatus Brocadia sp. AMX2]MBC6930187.1 hypothetical protein [Candidatus Jettenia sp.]RIJ88503.1 MAG: hypothetical protein DCC43_16085 [Candidatus Brocadia sp.]GAB62687.1 hypothetical protein KSU1_C1091 [Candidatus Jettenia caeni]MCQ3927061.1 hypothetical protein [Candidatus Jettenia sp.]
MKEIDADVWDDFGGDGEIDACEVCGRTDLQFGLSPCCCSMGSYSPGSAMCDGCEYDEVCVGLEGYK